MDFESLVRGVDVVSTLVALAAAVLSGFTVWQVARRGTVRYKAAPPPLDVRPRLSVGPPKEQARQESALRTAAGKLLYQIPPFMRLREVCIAEVRIGTEGMRALHSNFEGEGPVEEEDILVVEKMSVTLRGEPGAFQITEQSERIQLIGQATDASGEFQAQQFGRWLFELTPMRLGRRTLYVTVSGEVAGKNGSAQRSLPPRVFEVRVRVSVRAMFRGVALAVWGLIVLLLGGLVGAATQDLWWPHVRDALEERGIIESADSNAPN